LTPTTVAAVNEQRRRIHAVANVPAIATAFDRKDIGRIHPDLPANLTIPISAAGERSAASGGWATTV